ncbi:MAG: hypothetical protein HY903_20205 [Deltaproteobacteria bacterium]|nr:hypothetical protein [Deltaproteobacteria bacterium]
MHILPMLALVLAAPFTDVQNRFTIDLPVGWEFAPLPGDTSGAAFVRRIDERFASASVRLVPVGPGVTAQAWIGALLAAVERQPGFKLLMKDDAALGRDMAARRRYVVLVDGDQGRPKVSEDRVVVGRGVLFVAHVETLDAAFAIFEPDFAKIFASFAPAGSAAPAVRELGAVVGKWLMKDTPDTTFELRQDGTFDLAGVTGTFRIEGDLLLTRQANGAEENFNYRVEGQELVLSSPSFDEPMRYVRVDGALAAWHPVVGRWVGVGHRLELKPSGAAVLDGKGGTYTVAGAKLTLKIGSKRIVLGITLSGNTLRLTGERFGKGFDLKRQ